MTVAVKATRTTTRKTFLALNNLLSSNWIMMPCLFKVLDNKRAEAHFFFFDLKISNQY